MKQNYELYIIFNPELSADQITKEQNNINDLLVKEVKAQEIEVNQEGIRKLAYPIKKHRSGFYSLINFTAESADTKNLSNVEKKLNINDTVFRYIIINQTDFLKQIAKEKRTNVEITNHRELNKGKTVKNKCISKYMGLRVIDYKDVEFLNQFTSPYAKIFHRSKTGSSAKFQRKITKAIKRARHMALMPFTAIHNV